MRHGSRGDQLRVAIVITRMNVGGPARLVVSLATHMKDASTVILTGKEGLREGSMIEAARAAGANVVLVPGLRREPSPVHDLTALVWLLWYFLRERPDVVATHTAKAGAVGRLAAWLAWVPVRVHTFHGYVLEGYFGSALSTVYRFFERALSLITTWFVAISPAIATQLAEVGVGRRKTSVIRIGFDLEAFREHRPGRLRSEFGLDKDAELVGIVGRLVPIKAHEILLEAGAALVPRRPRLHVVIVGDGPRWAELHALRDELGLQDHVHFTGWRDDLVEIYSDLDVVVCCSQMEGTPSTIIEAGAAGRPVIGTRVGGLPDIILDGLNGVLIDPSDPPALVSALERILDNPDLGRKMGDEGRRLAFSRHAAVHFVEQTEQLYRNLVRVSAR